MKFPDSKLYVPEPVAASSISLAHLEVDPDRYHRFMPDRRAAMYGEDLRSCRACGGSARNPLHLEPIR